MTKHGSTMWHGFGLRADPKPFYLGMRKAANAVKRFGEAIERKRIRRARVQRRKQREVV